jgi:hypothetical protein
MSKRRRFGIQTEHSEIELEQTIVESIKRFPDYWSYLEMGCASGITLKAITDITKENRPFHYRIIGTDLPNGYSFNSGELLENFNYDINLIKYEDYRYKLDLTLNKTTVILTNARDFAASGQYGWNCVFIDADHSKNEVIKDFLAVEPHVEKGGFIMFHDAGEIETGSDLQALTGEYINVRGALKELGLLNNTRDGWKFVKEIPGGKAKGTSQWGNSCVVIEKL